MTKIQSIDALLDVTLPYIETILLRNSFGTSELKGRDLIHRSTDNWITIYHENSPSREAKSHIHIRKVEIQFARLIEPEGRTPQLELWGQEGPGDGKAPISLVFASFYDWLNEGKVIESHHDRYRHWCSIYGREYSGSKD